MPVRLRLPTRRALLAATAGLLLPRGLLAADAPRQGGTLAMAVWPDPPMLVSAFSLFDPVVIVSSKMTEGLLSYGYGFQPQPQLATAWQVARDGLSIRFTLRQGVRWHDGQGFSSADVAYSILQVLKQHHPLGRVAFADVTAVDTPDLATAILRLAKPSPMIMNVLAGTDSPMLPKHVYEPGGDPLHNPANNALVGTGPFRFVDWARGEHITLERNPDYWQPGKPYLDRIVIRIIADAGAVLEAGEIQLAGPNPVPYSEIARFRRNPKLTVETRGEELMASALGLQVNLRNPILAKFEVRGAIYQAINREALARVAWYGNARPATGPIPYQGGDYRAPYLPIYPYNPEAAEAALDAAGFKRDADQVRFKLRFDWALLALMPINEAKRRSVEFIQQSLRQVGIDVEVHLSDLTAYVRRVYTEYDYDLNLLLFNSAHDPSLGVQDLYRSKATLAGPPSANASGYASLDCDRALAAAATDNDPERRREEFWEFQRIVMTDLPVLPLLDLDYPCIIAKTVHDVMLRPESIRDSFADVWIEG